ncbi:unnamed protein product, partial [Pocillopora meandrina]
MEKNLQWWTEVAVIITVFIIGLVGNIFVLIIVNERNARKTIHGTFVTSLAIADLVLLCSDSSVSILQHFSLTSETYNCRVHLTVVTTGYNAGLFTITSMAIYRCHVVTNPWRPKLKRRDGKCKEDWPSLAHRQAYTVSLLTAQYILPLLITVICYIRIWLFMRNRSVFPRNSNLFTNRRIPGEENTRESVIILKTVAVIVFLFLVLLLPNQVAWMLLDFRNVSYEELWFVADIFTRLHSCLNPVVYGVMNKQYRHSYVTFLTRILC